MSFNISEILEKAKNVQNEMQRVKNDLENKSVTGESGGGMVKVLMTGTQKMLSLEIDDVVFTDKDMLKDLVVAAVNDATNRSMELAKDEMRKVSGMLPNIPGLNLGM